MRKLILKDSKKVLIEDLFLANSFFKRARGLLGRPCPKDNEGIAIFKCNSIHMFFMRYAISVVFMDSNGVVLKLVDSISPWRISTCKNAEIAIETKPYSLSAKGVRVGDLLEIV